MFTPIKSYKVYEQVIDQIKEMIILGKLKKGDKLPSERELVEQLKVSRTSIREAFRALEIIGLLECRQGEGNFIKENFENTFFEPLSIIFMLQKSNPKDIIEIRKIIEVGAASLAAQRITEEEIKELGELIYKIKNSSDENLNVDLDKIFHYKVAQASKNFILLNIINSCSSLINTIIKDARKKILMNEENKYELINQHEQIYNALKEGNSLKASKFMEEHIDLTNKVMFYN